MEILNAELKWIDDRCYRVLRIHDSTSTPQDDEIVPLRTYTEDGDDDNYAPDLPILHQGNKFYIVIHVPGQVVGYVRGKKSKNISEIQSSGVQVHIPPDRNAATIEITISGSTKKIVADAYYRIEEKVTTGRLLKDATHFISLPMNSPEIKKSFLKFKDEVLEKYKGVSGIDESIFQNPNKLHVTIALLVLLDERDKQNAIAILKKCSEDILKQIGTREFVVQVKGIEYMNDDPAEVDVLYAKLKEVDDDNRLQILSDNILKEFVKENFSKERRDCVKLHITIMNTLFRDKLEHQDDRLSRKTFDARKILKDYSEYDFGQIVVSEVHISVRYSTAVSSRYYVASHILKLNP